jgi:hypothetical protein
MFSKTKRHLWMPAALFAAFGCIGTAQAQLTDLTQTPNAENEGIVKSLQQQIGAGVGDLNTPGSSTFIMARDPARAVRRGRQLFQRKFTEAQGFGPRTPSGNIHTMPLIGAGMVDSCAGCHGRPRGSAGFGGDVFTKPDSRDAPHLFGLGITEQLADEATTILRQIRTDAINAARATNTVQTRNLQARSVSYGVIRANPNGTVDTSGVVGVDPDLRVKPFFHEGSTTSIREFVVGAFNDEMGLQAVDQLTIAAAAGARVVTPTGMVLNGATDLVKRAPPNSANDDPDGDGVRNELPQSLVDFMEFYLFNYFKPGHYRTTSFAGQEGQNRLVSLGCTACHIPNMEIVADRRVADVDTVYDPQRGIFNQLFATARVLFTAQNDGSGHPPLKVPNRGSFTVFRYYGDLKRHDLGPAFHERNFDGTTRTQFLTEPLWGVGSSPSYGHDGRSINLREVILRHGGEAAASRNAFVALSETQQAQVLEFLNELVLFPPDDTASNLNPGDRNNPQRAHGSIRLPALFNNPAELE